MWKYKATLVRVIDGDTVVLRLEKEYLFPIDFGFYIKEQLRTSKFVELPLRIMGIDAPEMVGTDKAQGLASKDALEKLLSSGELTATTYKPDKYGRWLVTIEVKLPDNSVIDVGTEMIKNGYAVPYLVK